MRVTVLQWQGGEYHGCVNAAAVPHGHGNFISSEGVVSCGKWSSGHLCTPSAAPSELVDVCHGRFAGNVDDQGRPVGDGCLFTSDHSLSTDVSMVRSAEGQWIDGAISGFVVLFGSTNGIERIEYLGCVKQRGTYHGDGAMFGVDGKLVCDGWYEDGFLIYGRQYENGSITYHGNFLNGLRHGRGIAYDHSGMVLHEGWWRYGHADESHPGSSAKLEAPFDPRAFDAITYEDGWYRGTTDVHGEPHGRGWYGIDSDSIFTARTVYCGTWKHGCTHKYGCDYDHKGRVLYRGSHRHNKRWGFGSMYDKRGNVMYVGEWVKDVPHGMGREYDVTGFMLYLGEWNDGERDGWGCEYHNGMRCFEGNWKNGARHGMGTTYAQDGTKSSSDMWRDGVLVVEVPGATAPDGANGTNDATCLGDEHASDNLNDVTRMRITYPDGSRYEGYVDEHDSSRPQGHGRSFRSDGTLEYDGLWDGRAHGQGTYFFASGNVSYEGEWRNGLRHGKGTSFYDHQRPCRCMMYCGTWCNNMRHGDGVEFFYVKGTVSFTLLGQFENDVFVDNMPIGSIEAPDDDSIFTRQQLDAAHSLEDEADADEFLIAAVCGDTSV